VSYRVGAYGMEALGIPSGPPTIICDGCRATLEVKGRHAPPAWFLNGKPPAKWKGGRGKDGRRDDRCPRCMLDPPATCGRMTP
jgi:hypothetical protein